MFRFNPATFSGIEQTGVGRPLGQATDWFEFAPHFGWEGAIERTSGVARPSDEPRGQTVSVALALRPFAAGARNAIGATYRLLPRRIRYGKAYGEFRQLAEESPEWSAARLPNIMFASCAARSSMPPVTARFINAHSQRPDLTRACCARR